MLVSDRRLARQITDLFPISVHLQLMFWTPCCWGILGRWKNIGRQEVMRRLYLSASCGVTVITTARRTRLITHAGIRTHTTTLTPHLHTSRTQYYMCDVCSERTGSASLWWRKRVERLWWRQGVWVWSDQSFSAEWVINYSNFQNKLLKCWCISPQALTKQKPCITDGELNAHFTDSCVAPQLAQLTQTF